MNLEILLFLVLNLVILSGSTEINSYPCGRPIMRRGNHLGGPQVARGDFPWNVALLTTDGKFFCDGTLISNKKIITAAHCIQTKNSYFTKQPNEIKINLGHYNLNNPTEKEAIFLDVKYIRIHPDWNERTGSYDADIAIIEMKDEVTFNNFVKPICLIEPSSEPALVTGGIVVSYDFKESGEIEDFPRIFDCPIKAYQTCDNYEDYHRSLWTSRANENEDMCLGNGGSGLIVKNNKTYYLRGISSSSLIQHTCDSNTYGIFTDALKFYEWIIES